MKTVTMLTLLAALHAVESGSGTDPKCGGNEYQITRRCVDDVNRILKIRGADWQYCHKDVYDPVKSRGIAIIHMSHYGELYRRRTGREPTARTYALIFHLGYRGMLDGRNRSRGDAYWRKVRDKMKEGEK